jgi:hypothetical protein
LDDVQVMYEMLGTLSLVQPSNDFFALDASKTGKKYPSIFLVFSQIGVPQQLATTETLIQDFRS